MDNFQKKVVDFLQNSFISFSRDEIKSLLNLIEHQRHNNPTGKYGLVFEFREEEVSFKTLYAAEKDSYKSPLLNIKITGEAKPVNKTIELVVPPPSNKFDAIFFSERIFSDYLKDDKFGDVHFYGSVTVIFGNVGGYDTFFNLIAQFQYNRPGSQDISTVPDVLPFELGLPCPPNWPPIGIQEA